MPLVATAVAAGKTAFALLPKDKESRQKAAEKLKKGFQWVGKGLSKIKNIKKTETGYTVTSGEDDEARTFSFSGFGKTDNTPKDNELMKYAPYIIGGLILLTMKK